MRRALAAAALVAAAALALTGCGGSGNADTGSNPFTRPPIVKPEPERLQGADVACHTPGVVTDGGQALVIDNKGDEDVTGLSITKLACLIRYVKTPDYVIDQMDSTTSLMGLREANWNGYHAEWSYHPDNGLDITIVDTEFDDN